MEEGKIRKEGRRGPWCGGGGDSDVQSRSPRACTTEKKRSWDGQLGRGPLGCGLAAPKHFFLFGFFLLIYRKWLAQINKA